MGSNRYTSHTDFYLWALHSNWIIIWAQWWQTESSHSWEIRAIHEHVLQRYWAINQAEKWLALCSRSHCKYCIRHRTSKGKTPESLFVFLPLHFCSVMQGIEAERGREPSNKPTNWSCNTQLDWHLSGKYFISIGDNLTWDMDKWEA